jgi:nicotinate dehydrogenase subunit A
LYVLRNDMQLNGPKFGCGLGECGACAVLIDGKVARSCSVPLKAVDGRRRSPRWKACRPTPARPPARKPCGPRRAGCQRRQQRLLPPPRTYTLHVVQQAFVDAQAAQCGYCTNGMIMALVALFNQQPKASDEEIRHALSGHLCRCGTHVEIMQAAAAPAS